MYRPKDSYLGGGSYGHRGGYDIAMVKVFRGQELEGYQQIRHRSLMDNFLLLFSAYFFYFYSLPNVCLDEMSGSSYVLGYGSSKRLPCEVTHNHGPEKAGYCAMDVQCQKELGDYAEEDQCGGVKFKYRDKTFRKCSFDPTPSSENKR